MAVLLDESFFCFRLFSRARVGIIVYWVEMGIQMDWKGYGRLLTGALYLEDWIVASMAE